MTDIIIAWYNERDIEQWIPELTKDNRVFIYVKGICSLEKEAELYDKGVYKIEYLENIGREAHTWLKYIIDRLENDDLPERIVLLQGDPFFHFSGENKYLKHNPKEFAKKIINHTCNKVEPLLCYMYREYKTPMFSSRLEIEKAWKNVFENYEKMLPKVYEFAAGAQYICSKECIISKDIYWWKQLYEKLVTDQINAWEIERLWYYIFII